MPVEIAEPWLSFLRDVDSELSQRIEVHCLGGFVLSALWSLPRPTGDVDIVEVEPSSATEELLSVAGEGSELSRRYHLQFHKVTVAEYPERYASRLIDITPRGLTRLHLSAFEVHDLVLAKISRNSPRDREDVRYLANKGILDRTILEERFTAELRPYLLNEARETATLELWLDEFFRDPQSSTTV